MVFCYRLPAFHIGNYVGDDRSMNFLLVIFRTCFLYLVLYLRLLYIPTFNKYLVDK
jgi:hypothetical protein